MNQVVGRRFPDLELPDHAGEVTRLSAIAGKFPLVLIFYRGYW
jgi:peroxiredoxin